MGWAWSFDSWGNKQFGTPTDNPVKDFGRGVGGGLGLFYDAGKDMVVDGWDCVSNQNGPISISCGSTAINIATFEIGGASKGVVKQVGNEAAEQAAKEAAESGLKNITREAIEGCLTHNEEREDRKDTFALLIGGMEVEAAGCLVKQPKPLSTNQMQQAINKNKAPSGITQAHSPKLPFEKPHVHFNGNENIALNKDGTWKHSPPESFTLTKEQKNWLTANGWTIPAGF